MRGAFARVLMTCLTAGCVEPTFVSLGRNDEAVLSVPDAAGPPSPPPDDAGSFPSACPEGADSVALTSACETRRAINCPDVDFPPEEALAAVLSSLLRECGEQVNQLRVSFAGGCADRFELADNASSIAVAARSCIALRLDAERYDCAAELSCGLGAVFGIPTSVIPAGSSDTGWH